VEYGSSQFSTSKKSTLVIAHPGHELRVCHWLELAQPTVFILTDGSGRSGKSRLGSTTKVLEQAGGRRKRQATCCKHWAMKRFLPRAALAPHDPKASSNHQSLLREQVMIAFNSFCRLPQKNQAPVFQHAGSITNGFDDFRDIFKLTSLRAQRVSFCSR